MEITVFGLWHLGCVTAACVAAAGNHVVGFDLDAHVVADLKAGKPPISEPGLAELVAAETKAGRLMFTTSPAEALTETEILWVAFDTPVNEKDEADVDFVRSRLNQIGPSLRAGTIVLISSQVPAGFTRELQKTTWGSKLRFAYSPENLRLGKAIDVFRHPERVVLGVSDESIKPRLTSLFAPFSDNIVWMSVESAEMTKHAINAFLATSVTFANELARLCEAVGADAKEVERGLKSEGRIGPKAYLAPGVAFSGGTLARDLRFLTQFGRQHHVRTPLFDGVIAGNDVHKGWTRDKIAGLLKGVSQPVVAVLGLTYKPGTDTLRRSASVELCRWMHGQGYRIQAHDPAVGGLPDDLKSVMSLHTASTAALTGADLAVVATEWPDFRKLSPQDFLQSMRRPAVIDPNWFLAQTLSAEPTIRYVTTGRDSATVNPHE
ncbi:MAG TPA: nucleotide sugar dehydrogenase [Tepidisphaeraceae bacterium]|jgi:UDPglucose 6-dehydrogenase